MKDFPYHATTDEQRKDVRRQLLTQRLAQLEAEHTAAAFGLEQIEKAIKATQRDLQDLLEDHPKSSQSEPKS